MLTIRNRFCFCYSLILAFFMVFSANASCGKVTIAEMNWATAQLMANVDKIILSKGFGCEVETVPGDTMPSFTSMNEKGKPDIAPELWANSVRIPLKKAEKEGRLHTVNKGPISGLGEGWWIPSYTAKKYPELKTVLDVLNRPDLFPHSEDKSKGAFVGCPAGWGCQLANANLFRAFQMKQKGWVLVDPGSAAGLDGSIVKSVERKKNWFGYYWTPTVIVGKYNLRKIPFGVPFGGRENWDSCIAKPEQECANPKPSAWTKSVVWSVITDKLKKRSPIAVNYLQNRVFPGEVMNSMIVYMQANQADGSDGAREFIKKHKAIWSKWIPKNLVAKISN